MKISAVPPHLVLLGVVALTATLPARALTDIQIGPSGRSYASAGLACGMHPVDGLSPRVDAGLYNPKPRSRATVTLDGARVARLDFQAPDATVWIPTGAHTVAVSLGRRTTDTYSFDATPVFDGQPNVCIPDTRGNAIDGELETAASGHSNATATPGCALNPATGIAQPYVNLTDAGTYLLNVSVNGTPLTQLDGTRRVHVPVFLSAGLNVVTATDPQSITDAYVRDGGDGRCTLP